MESLKIKAIKYYVNKVIAHYFQGPKQNQANPTQLSRIYYAEKLHLKSSISNRLNLPIQSNIQIGMLNISVQDQTKSPIKFNINIQGVNIKIQQLPISKWQQRINQSFQYEQINNVKLFCSKIVDDFMKNKNGLFKKIVGNIIDNLSLTINNITFVYQTTQTTYKADFQGKIDQITVEKKNKSQKTISISQITIYQQEKTQKRSLFTLNQALVYLEVKQKKQNNCQTYICSNLQYPKVCLNYTNFRSLTNLTKRIFKYTQYSQEIKLKNLINATKQTKKVSSQKCQEFLDYAFKEDKQMCLDVKIEDLKKQLSKTIKALLQKGKQKDKEQQKRLKQKKQSECQSKLQIQGQQESDKSNEIKQEELIAKYHRIIGLPQTMDYQQVKKVQIQASNYDYSNSSLNVTIHFRKLQLEIVQQSLVTASKGVKIQTNLDFTIHKNPTKSIEQLKKYELKHSQAQISLKNLSISLVEKSEKKYRQILTVKSAQIKQKRFYRNRKDLFFLDRDINLCVKQVDLQGRIKDFVYGFNVLESIMKQGPQKPNKDKSFILPQQYYNAVKNQIQQTTNIEAKLTSLKVSIKNHNKQLFCLFADQTDLILQNSLINFKMLVTPTIKISYFNPKSQSFQPMIQPFKTNLYYEKFSLNQQSVALKIKSTTNQQTSSLKANISSQLLSNLQALNQQINYFKQYDKQNFTFQNLTGRKIRIKESKTNYFDLNDQKSIKKQINSDQLTFQLQRQYTFGLDQYGVFKIKQTCYCIEYSLQNQNKVIKFIPKLFIRNKTDRVLYLTTQLKEYKIEINKEFSLQYIDKFNISLIGQQRKKEKQKIKQQEYKKNHPQLPYQGSYKQREKEKQRQKEKEGKKEKKLLKYTQVDTLIYDKTIVNQSEQTCFLIDYQQKINKYGVINLIAPLIIHNCLPKNISLQFVRKSQTFYTKQVDNQKSLQIYTNKKVESLQIKVKVDGYGWSNGLKFNPQKDNNERLFQLIDKDKNQIALNFIFKKDKSTSQYILIIYCKKYIINKRKNNVFVANNLQIDQQQKNNFSFHLIKGNKKEQSSKSEDTIFLMGTLAGNKIKVSQSHLIIDKAASINIGGQGQWQYTVAVKEQEQELPDKKDKKNKQKKLWYSPMIVKITTHQIMQNCNIYTKKIVLKDINITSRLKLIGEKKQQKQQHKMGYQQYSQQSSLVIKTQLKEKCLWSQKEGILFSESLYFANSYKYIFSSNDHQSKPILLPNQSPTYFQIENQLYTINLNRTEKINNEQINNYEIIKVTGYQLLIIVKSNKLTATYSSSPTQIAYKGSTIHLQNQQHDIKVTIKNQQNNKQHQYQIVIPQKQSNQGQEPKKYKKSQQFFQQNIVVNVTMQHKKIVVEIDQRQNSTSTTMLNREVSINIPEIIISIIHNSPLVKIPFQSIVATLRNVNFVMIERQNMRNYQFKVFFLQIDQMNSHNLPSPTVISSNKDKYFCNLTFRIPNQNQGIYKLTVVEQVCLDVGDMTLNLSADFIQVFLQIINQFEISAKGGKSLLLNEKYFVDCIKISPFSLDLCVCLKDNRVDLQKSYLLTLLLSSAETFNSNINKQIINIPGIQVKSRIHTNYGTIGQLISYYQKILANKIFETFSKQTCTISFKDQAAQVSNILVKPQNGFSKDLALVGIQYNDAKINNSQQGVVPLTIIKSIFQQGRTEINKKPTEGSNKEGGQFKPTFKKIADFMFKPISAFNFFESNTVQEIRNNCNQKSDQQLKALRHPRIFFTKKYVMRDYSKRQCQIYFLILQDYTQRKKLSVPIIVDIHLYQKRQYLILLQSSVAFAHLYQRKIKWEIDYSQLRLVNNRKKDSLTFQKKKMKEQAAFFKCGSSDQHELCFHKQGLRQKIANSIIDLKNEL